MKILYDLRMDLFTFTLTSSLIFDLKETIDGGGASGRL